MVFNKYFIFTRSEEVLKKIVDTYLGETVAVADHEKFYRVRDNVRRDKGFVYYEPSKLFDYYVGDEPSSSMSLIKPVVDLVESQGHSVMLGANELVVQTYMNFRHEGDGQMLSRLTDRYDATLLEIMPPDFEYFWGSHNISRIIGELGGVLNNLHPSSFNILEGVLNAKKEQYFGFEVDLREDLYKVFENEFALGLYPKGGYIHFLFMAKKQNSEHIAKLEAYYLDQMMTREYEVLSEGIMDDDTQEEDLQLPEISVFPFDSQANIYSSMLGGTLVVGTDRELVVQALRNLKVGNMQEKRGLKVHRYLQGFDEVNIMSPAFMANLLGGKAAAFLNSLSQIQAAKTVFMDGMAVVHVFEF